MAHVVILIAELQRNKGLKAAGTVLQFTQAAHVVNTMGISFDMPVQHGGIAE